MIVAVNVGVTTSPTQVSAASDGTAQSVAVSPVDGVVYVAGSSSTATTDGFPLQVGQVLTVLVRSGEALYLRTASGTVNARVLRAGATA